MTNQRMIGSALLFWMLYCTVPPAHALTVQECSARFKAAREAGTLGDQSGMTSARASAAVMQRPPRLRPPPLTNSRIKSSRSWRIRTGSHPSHFRRMASSC
jgi:hypothetical protein